MDFRGFQVAIQFHGLYMSICVRRAMKKSLTVVQYIYYNKAYKYRYIKGLCNGLQLAKAEDDMIRRIGKVYLCGLAV